MDPLRPSLSNRDVELDDFEGAAPAHESTQEVRGPAPGKLGRGQRPKVMRKATGLASTPAASRYVDAASRSTGRALPRDLRGRLESSLGSDLGGVRIHTGGDSARAAQSVAARAYTVGQDIHFGAGHYDPSSIEGQRLIAHEVAHTVQQIGGGGSVQTKLEVSAPGDAHEVEADRFADAFVSGRAAGVSRGSVGTGIHRKASGDHVHRHDESFAPAADADKLAEFLGVEDASAVREADYRGFIRVRGAASAVAQALADLEALSKTSVGSKLLSDLEKAAADDKGRLEVFVVDHGKGFPTSLGPNPAFAGARTAEQGRDAAVKVAKPRAHPKTGMPIGRSLNADGSLKVAGPGTPVAVEDIRVAYDTTVMDRLGPGGPSFVPLAHELIHALGMATGTNYPTTMVDKATGTNHEELRTTGLGPYAKNEMSENALRREIGMEERDRYSSLTGPKGRTSPPPGIELPQVSRCDVVSDAHGWLLAGSCKAPPPPDADLSLALRVVRGEQSILTLFTRGFDPSFQFVVGREKLGKFLRGTQEVVFEIEPTFTSKHWAAVGMLWRSKPIKVTFAAAPVQRKASGGAQRASASGDLDAASRSTGRALPRDLRGRLESSLGSDLGGVRIHTGGDSARAAQSVAARAYTVGQDIHFGAGHYDPSSIEGQRLIAHEVAHTVQQLGGGGSVQTKLEVSAPGDAHEVEADRFADAFVSGRASGVSRGSVGTGIHRKQDPAVASESASESQSGVENAPAQSGPIVESADPSLNGRPAAEVASELAGKLRRYQAAVPGFLKSARWFEQQEREWAQGQTLIGKVIDVFNRADKPDPKRWEGVVSVWQELPITLNEAIAVGTDPDDLRELGRAAESAFGQFRNAFELMQAAQSEFSAYLSGFTASGEKVGAAAEFTRDAAFAGAVAIAVVVAAPVVATAAAAGAASVGLTGTAATVATGVTTAGAMGVMGGTMTGGLRATAAGLSEGYDVLKELVEESGSWEQAIDSFDWGAVGSEGWDGFQRGFIDGVLALVGVGLDKLIYSGVAKVVPNAQHIAGSLWREVLRRSLAHATTGGASGAIAGALDAGLRAAIDGADWKTIRAAMVSGAKVGGAIGAALGGGAGAVEGRRAARAARPTPPVTQSSSSQAPTKSAEQPSDLMDLLGDPVPLSEAAPTKPNYDTYGIPDPQAEYNRITRDLAIFEDMRKRGLMGGQVDPDATIPGAAAPPPRKPYAQVDTPGSQVPDYRAREAQAAGAQGRLGSETSLEDALVQRSGRPRATDEEYGRAMAEVVRDLEGKMVSGELRTQEQILAYMSRRTKEVGVRTGRTDASLEHLGMMRPEETEALTPMVGRYAGYAEKSLAMRREKGAQIHDESGIELTEMVVYEGLPHWRHTDPSQFPAINAKADEILSSISSAQGHQSKLGLIAEYHWYMAHMMPYARGSAGATDGIVKALLRQHGFQVGRTRAGVQLDLEAISRPKEDFVARYSSFYEFEDATLHRKASGGSVAESGAAHVSAAASTSGRQLDGGLRTRLEAFSGHDLGTVRVHTGSESAAASKAVGAHAYAQGQSIHFAAGTYDPSSSRGQELIAHEVAHTIQQRGGSLGVQTKLAVSGAADSHEREADAFAAAFVSGASTFAIRGSASTGTLHRKEDKQEVPTRPGVGGFFAGIGKIFEGSDEPARPARVPSSLNEGHYALFAKTLKERYEVKESFAADLVKSLRAGGLDAVRNKYGDEWHKVCQDLMVELNLYKREAKNANGKLDKAALDALVANLVAQGQAKEEAERIRAEIERVGLAAAVIPYNGQSDVILAALHDLGLLPPAKTYSSHVRTWTEEDFGQLAIGLWERQYGWDAGTLIGALQAAQPGVKQTRRGQRANAIDPNFLKDDKEGRRRLFEVMADLGMAAKPPEEEKKADGAVEKVASTPPKKLTPLHYTQLQAALEREKNLNPNAVITRLKRGGIDALDAWEKPVVTRIMVDMGLLEPSKEARNVNGRTRPEARALVQRMLGRIKSTARQRATSPLKIDKGSNFYTRLENHYLKEYLANPSAKAGKDAAENKIGEQFKGPASDDTWEQGAVSSWNKQDTPHGLQVLRPSMPKSIGAATAILSRANTKVLPLIDAPHLLGGDNTSRGQDADVQGGGRNISQLMHWATGVKYSQVDATTMREMFLVYEYYHLEGWDVFAEDPINDLIAEEQGRLLGTKLRGGKVNKGNLAQVIDETFMEARAWVGTLLRARKADLDAWITAEKPRSAKMWWSDEDPWNVWGYDTLYTMLLNGFDPDEVFETKLAQSAVEIYRLVYEAALWESKHGAIENSAFIENLLQGDYNQVLKKIIEGRELSNRDLVGAFANAYVDLW